MCERPTFLLPVKSRTSPSCSPTPISYRMNEFWRFGHEYGPNCIFSIAHARNGHISTSGQNSDIIIVFADPDFLQDAGILAIRRPPTNSFLLLGVYTSVSNLVKIDKEMRPWEWRHTDRQTDRHTDTQTDANSFYYLSHAMCKRMGQIIILWCSSDVNRNIILTEGWSDMLGHALGDTCRAVRGVVVGFAWQREISDIVDHHDLFVVVSGQHTALWRVRKWVLHCWMSIAHTRHVVPFLNAWNWRLNGRVTTFCQHRTARHGTLRCYC